MSFDIFLQRFAMGQPADVEPQPVRAALASREYSGPDSYGFYRVKLADGDEVEMSAKGLDGAGRFGGCAFHVRRMSPDLVQFIWEIAAAGDMMLLPTMKESIAILSSPEQRRHLPADLTTGSWNIVVCKSAAELQILLLEGYAGSRQYRDQIVNGNQKERS